MQPGLHRSLDDQCVTLDVSLDDQCVTLVEEQHSPDIFLSDNYHPDKFPLF